MQDDLSIEALKPFNDLLKEAVEARKLSGGKIERLTAMAIKDIQYDSQIITNLYNQHRSLQPRSASKIHSLYCFDSIARACRSKVNKKISANIDGERGTCAGFLLKAEGVLDGLVRDMLDTGGKDWPDGREKTKKILDIWQKGSTFSKEVIHRLQVLVEAATPAPTVIVEEVVRQNSSEDPLKVSRSSTPSTSRKDVSRSTTTPTSSPPSLTLPSQGYFLPTSTPLKTSTIPLPIRSSGGVIEPPSDIAAISTSAPTPPPVGVPASLLTLLQKFTSSSPSPASAPSSDALVSATLETPSNPSPVVRIESSATVIPSHEIQNSVSTQIQHNASADPTSSVLSGPPTMPPFPPTMSSSVYPTFNPDLNVPIHSSNSFPTYAPPVPGPINPMLHQANYNYNYNQVQNQMFPVQNSQFDNTFNGPQFEADQGPSDHQSYIGSTVNNGINENRWRPGGSGGNSRGRGGSGGGRGGYRGRGGMNGPGYNEGSRGVVPTVSSLPSNLNLNSQSVGDSTSNSTKPPPSDDPSTVPPASKKRKSRFDQPPSHPAPAAPVPTSTSVPTPTPASIQTPIYPLTSFNPTMTPNVRNQPSALASLSWSTFNPENPRSWEDLSIAFARDNHGLLPSNEVLYALGTTMMMKFGG
ncbi:RNA polymerase II C-terminal domain-binding protein RA4, contains RPR and RRM domains [Phaffia rhodozyma]|uniref:RNA polymerase II C-terminal domain-binding protein RA4, contains RPR and RRM domains n=1 Tax=Phaffia rhodozyma TaxID=264483 RepID=A0A0F7SM77_PHARH|nr:RNA polymerase II C-terminal domain-binding protein RA4, contains RPR and RRM domains [Phaffia rhodozyma]